MSTKTSIKRIAAVAAVALTLGGFSAVSAHAVANTTTVAVATVATTPVSGVVGTATTADNITLTTTTAPTLGEVITLTPTVVSKPSGSTVVVGTVGANKVGLNTATISVNWLAAAAAGVVTQTSQTTAIAAAGVAATLQLNADVAGTYVVAVTPSGALTTNTPVTVTFYITGGTTPVSSIAAGAPSSASAAAPVAGTYSAITLNAGTQDKYYTITSSGVGTVSIPSITSVANAPGGATAGVSSTGATWFHTTASGDVPGSGTNDVFVAASALSFSAFSSASGTQTITIKGDVSAAVTATLTWGAAAALVAQYATTQIVAGPNSVNGAGILASTSNRYTGLSDSVVASATYNNTAPSAVVGVALASAYDTLITGYLTATITGAGAVSIVGNSGTFPVAITSGTPQGASVTTSFKDSTFQVGVYADGRPGVGTLVISSGTTTIATKTVTFVGAATKVVATQVLKVAKAGSTLGVVNGAATSVLTDPAFTVDVTDANGNAATLPANFKVKSSASTVITVANSDCVAETGVPGTYDCVVQGAGGALSGSSATVTFSLAASSTEVADATTGLYSIKSDPITFAVGGSVSTVVLTTDAADYTPLAPIKLIATAKDSKGNAAYDKDFTNTGAATDLLVSLKSSSALAGGTLTSPLHLIGGVATLTGIYAPSIESTVLITGVENVDGLATAATSATFTVSNGSVLNSSQAATDAAQEATDAANAAYDAANNAMDSADAATAAAQDASDNASAALAAVTSLSATVAKLVSSVTAIATALAAIKKKLGVK